MKKFITTVILAVLLAGCNKTEIDFSQLGVENIVITQTEQGRLTQNGKSATVCLLGDYEKYGDILYHDTYIFIENRKTAFYKKLESGCYGDVLYLCDVDGDGLDEIVVQQTIGMSGGAGQYVSSVYKAADGELTEMFYSPNSQLFDTGFEGSLGGDGKLAITNRFTGYSVIVDSYLSQEYIDEIGSDGEILADSFREFVPADVDNDGVFEIECLQCVSFESHTNYIGDAKTVLKYNIEKGGFEVVSAEFVVS